MLAYLSNCDKSTANHLKLQLLFTVYAMLGLGLPVRIDPNILLNVFCAVSEVS